MSGWGGTTTLKVLAMARSWAAVCHNVKVKLRQLQPDAGCILL